MRKSERLRYNSIECIEKLTSDCQNFKWIQLYKNLEKTMKNKRQGYDSI